jgi:CRP/FNR family transcriptional regulator, cyclic AMP receptor protein
MKEAELSRETLRQIPLCSGFTDHECDQLAGAALLMKFQTGEVVLRQGKSSQNLWVLLEGECQVIRQLVDHRQREEEVVLAELPAGSTFGEMSFFHAAPHSASVRAKTPVKLLRLERSRYDALLASGSQAAMKLAVNTVTLLAERLRKMDDWVVALLTRTGEQRNQPEWTQLREKMFRGWDNV